MGKHLSYQNIKYENDIVSVSSNVYETRRVFSFYKRKEKAPHHENSNTLQKSFKETLIFRFLIAKKALENFVDVVKINSPILCIKLEQIF